MFLYTVVLTSPFSSSGLPVLSFLELRSFCVLDANLLQEYHLPGSCQLKQEFANNVFSLLKLTCFIIHIRKEWCDMFHYPHSQRVVQTSQHILKWRFIDEPICVAYFFACHLWIDKPARVLTGQQARMCLYDICVAS